MLAGEFVDQGKTDEGLNMAMALLDNTDKDRPVYFALGNMYTACAAGRKPKTPWPRQRQWPPRKKTALPALPQGRAGRPPEKIGPAETYFRQALDLDPNNAMTLNYLGYMFADKGLRLPEAIKLIRKAVEQEPMNGAYLDSLGWVYFKMGEYEMAEDNLRQAVERDQTDPTVHDHLGDLYEKTGRIRLAAAQWELSIAELREVPRHRHGARRSGQGAAQA